MSHIHDKPGQVDFTVTIYVFRRHRDHIEAMLHMHKKHQRFLPVGGHIEVDETPWQAVAHELVEESGYELARTQVLQPVQRLRHMSRATLHPQPLALNTHAISEDHFHSDIAYALYVEDEPTRPLADGESADIRWLSSKEIEQLNDTEIFANTREVCKYVMDNFDDWELIQSNDFSLKK